MSLSIVRSGLEAGLQLGPLGHGLLGESTPVRVEEVHARLVLGHNTLGGRQEGFPHLVHEECDRDKGEHKDDCVHC